MATDTEKDVVRPRNVTAPSQGVWVKFFEDELDDAVQDLADGYPVNETSLAIDWWTMYEYSAELAWGVITHPVAALGASHKPVTGSAQQALAEDHSAILDDAPVRVSSLPPERSLRVGDLRTEMLGTLVDVEGEVAHVEAVEPWMKEAAYECRQCGTLSRVPQSYGDLWQPPECEGCGTSKNQGIFQLHQAQSTLVDYQFAVLAPLESSLDDPPTINLILKHDLVGRIEQGDELTVTGVYETSPMDLQTETQLNVYLEGVALDVDERVEADKVKTSELDDYIADAVRNPEEYGIVDEGGFGVDIGDVVAAVHDHHGVRREEVRSRVDGDFADDRTAIKRGGNRLFHDE